MTAKSKVFGVTQLATGAIVPSGDVTVYVAGTLTKASIYADSAGAIPKSNPFQADQYGMWNFYASSGLYDIKLSIGNSRSTTLTDYAVC